MSRRLSSRHSIDSCTIQLHSWRPFKALDSSDHPYTPPPPKPYSSSSAGGGLCPKRPCLSDRATTPFTADSIDLSRLSLFDDDRPIEGSLRLMARKRRRRRGSRSLSGRSSDHSGTRRCCSVGATCSDLPVVAGGTDSSGELFGNGDWGSDASEAKNSRRDRDREDNLSVSGLGFGGQIGNFDALGNESGYGSEPGYRGDAEFGYGDEVDEEEEDSRILFWGDQSGDADSKMEMVGENSFSDQKAHHRGRRKKHDCKMIDSSR
ncbi:uncharacterized protein LOC116216005 [Punica granatum]|uniref:Uncharacterized protein n=2 Tax=Punica granatum TaxID=22663 RepID=A0A218VUH4_PUNGR|nr:uncharacterized protein LOC116216005 [Punica granatum]OWM63552.1 hypothetical protein CDL15_Pgr019502 [Punica granatum]PKI31506.1 hypothetical protein CRG98_048087 [Punica granatum]